MTPVPRTFSRESVFETTREELAAWHFRPGALERLVPGWSGVRVVRSLERMEEGAVAELDAPLALGLRTRIEAVHEAVEVGRQFVDRMVRGPFPWWRHTHSFSDATSDGAAVARLVDQVEYRLPFGPIGSLGGGFVRRELERMFAWRHARTAQDLRRHRDWAAGRERRPLRIAISGATGLVGSALAAFLTTGGHVVQRIVRRRERPSDVVWDVERGSIDRAALEGADAVVHLAGEPIAGRWNARRRAAIRESRVRGTTLLATTIAGLERRPEVLVSASAIGFYGDRPTSSAETPLDETAASGDGYLAEVCRAWESAAAPAASAGIRVVHPRIGMVLASAGGALKAMLTPFRIGAGGPIGSGRQGVSWIALDDLVASIHFVIGSPALRGPYNAVAPTACPQREFARTLGRALRRPAFAPMPSFAVNVLFGEMGRELLLAGSFLRPAALAHAGFRWEFPTLAGALRFELGLPPHDRRESTP